MWSANSAVSRQSWKNVLMVKQKEHASDHEPFITLTLISRPLNAEPFIPS